MAHRSRVHAVVLALVFFSGACRATVLSDSVCYNAAISGFTIPICYDVTFDTCSLSITGQLVAAGTPYGQAQQVCGVAWFFFLFCARLANSARARARA